MATGSSALANNTTGSYNTADGYFALKTNTILRPLLQHDRQPQFDRRVYALYHNTTGIGNVGEIQKGH